MNKIGHPVTKEELKEIMAEHDVEKNNVITFSEFKNIFFDYKDHHYSQEKKEWKKSNFFQMKGLKFII